MVEPQYETWDAWAEEFDKVISQYRPQEMKTILEWGAGISTVGFHRFAREASTELMVTIDHHGPYLKSVLERLEPEPFLRSHGVPLSETKSMIFNKRRYFYSTVPLHYRRLFDTIFVDGRVRNECLLTAALVAEPGAFIMLHDFRRARYMTAKCLFEEVDSDWQGCLILRVKPELQEIFSTFLETLPESGGVAALEHSDLGEGGEFTPSDLECFEALLNKWIPNGCENVLEWGTRASTRTLFDYVQRFKPRHYLSIKAAIASLSERASLSGEYSYFDEKAVSLIGLCEPGGRDPNLNYSTCPVTSNRKYDFVYVGRERRNDCLLTAALLLKEGGVVILRDGDQAHYRTGRFLFDTLEQAEGFTVLRTKALLRSVFDGIYGSLSSAARTAGIDLAD